MLFTVILLLGIPLVFGRCPGGWLQHSRSCYVLNQETTTWYEAQEICRASGGHLAWIDSAEENAFIVTTVNPSDSDIDIMKYLNALDLTLHLAYYRQDLIAPLRVRGKRVWIGLHDNAEELKFVWVDTPQLPIYTNWFPGEPNSYLGRDEDCVEMWNMGQWNDDMCTVLRPSVCEKPYRTV